MMPKTCKSTIRIAHLTVEFNIDNRKLSRFTESWFKDFIIDSAIDPDIKVNFKCLKQGIKADLHVPNEAEKMDSMDNTDYYVLDDDWFILFEDVGRMKVERDKNKITACVYHENVLGSIDELENLLHPLFELFRQNGLYPYHSAGLSKDGYGLLMPGQSGNGKTTLSMELINNGFSFLSDDWCFLSRSEGKYMLTGFLEDVNIYTENVKHIKKLKHIKSSDKNIKVPVNIKKIFPESIIRETELKGILFPVWEKERCSSIETICAHDAVTSIMPLTMICFDKKTVERHFDFNCEIVKDLHTGKIVLGHDKDKWTLLVNRFIEEGDNR
jgi:hypothetical protein